MPVLNRLQVDFVGRQHDFFASRLGEADPGDTQVNEPSDVIPGSTATTYSVAIGGSETGVMNFLGDRDWFSVTLVAGQTYTFTLTGSGGSPLFDPFLELRNSAGTIIASNDDINYPSNPNSSITFTVSSSGTYYLTARAYEGEGGYTGGYTVTASVAAPETVIDSIDWGYQMPTTSIDVYFATTGQIFNGETAVRSWTGAEIASAMAALATFSTFTPLTFTQVGSSTGAEVVLTLADIGGDTLGYFQVGTPYGFFNPNGTGWNSTGLQQGGYGFVTLIHELGHGFGLAHPHDNGGTSTIMQGVTSPFGSYGNNNLNQGVYTMMSYNDGWQLGPLGLPSSSGLGWQGTPMALDIAMLQQLYGANTTYNNGATTYNLLSITSMYQCIWDAGGSDTIAYGGSAATNIDLRAATLQYEAGGGGWISYVSGVHGGFTIANGVIIENASGGSGADVLTGNTAANQLSGNAGVDLLRGDLGNDTLDGGAGVDTANYAMASTGATWVRNTNGSWTVTSTDGTDTVNNVEFLDFSDRDVFLDRAVYNFSGDGTSDILLRRFSDGVTVIWTVNGASVTSSAPTQWQAGSQWTLQGFGDFNSDGRDDFLLRRTSDGVTSVWTMNGTTVVAADVTNWQAGNEWQIQAVGDFNGDLRDDFLWRRTTDGVTSIWQMNGTTVVQADVTQWQAGNQWQIQGVGDFNGDGRDDFLWRRTSDGVTSIWNMNGTAVASADVTNQQAGTEWTFAGIGDFNGDGRDDLLLRRTDGATSIWTMNGNTVTSSGITSQQAGSDWQIAAVGDCNGDGREDILLRHDGDGLLAIWFMNGTTVTSSSLTSQQAGADWGII